MSLSHRRQIEEWNKMFHSTKWIDPVVKYNVFSGIPWLLFGSWSVRHFLKWCLCCDMKAEYSHSTEPLGLLLFIHNSNTTAQWLKSVTKDDAVILVRAYKMNQNQHSHSVLLTQMILNDILHWLKKTVFYQCQSVHVPTQCLLVISDRENKSVLQNSCLNSLV